MDKVTIVTVVVTILVTLFINMLCYLAVHWNQAGLIVLSDQLVQDFQLGLEVLVAQAVHSDLLIQADLGSLAGPLCLLVQQILVDHLLLRCLVDPVIPELPELQCCQLDLR